MAKIAVLGSGAWGSALACISARAGHETFLWGRSQPTVSEINDHLTNQAYLGDLQLHPGIHATTDLSIAVEHADVIILATPAQSIASLLETLPRLPEGATLLSTCKGIHRETGRLPTQLIEAELPGHSVAALSGPSFATDVVADLPTAVTIASRDTKIAEGLCAIFSAGTFRCYASGDLNGVELGGALKNVLALAVGASRAMELGASAEAALVARGFAEMMRVATALGAQRETLAGLSGLGDLVLTCSSTQSRNFTYGMALGQNENLEGMKLAEGAFTAGIALDLAKEKNIDAPITKAIVDVLEKRITAREAVHNLLTRPLKREN